MRPLFSLGIIPKSVTLPTSGPWVHLDGGAPATGQFKRLFGESKTSSSGQKAKSRSEITARLQKVWQSEVPVLHLLKQHQDPHRHPDWAKLANKAIHHM